MELAITVARSTLKHIFHNHHNIFRQNAKHKFLLTAYHIEAKLTYDYMVLDVTMKHIVLCTRYEWNLNQ